MEASSALTEDERVLIAWLEAEPAASVADDLAAFRARLGAGGAAALAVLDAASARLLDMAERMRAHLLALQLPVPADQYELAERLCGALLDVAARFDERAGEPGRAGVERAALSLSGLDLLTEVFVLSSLVAAPAPAGSWRVAHRLARSADVLRAAPDEPARCAYLRIVAIATAQPEGLTGRELAWAFQFLDARVLGAAGFDDGAPDGGAAAWWIDPTADQVPQAVARTSAPEPLVQARRLWSFNPRPMAQKLGECLEWVTAHMTAAELAGMQCEVEPLAADEAGFPAGLSPLETLALLRRLRGYWMATPVREQPRRQSQYAVQVCIGLGTIWELGQQGRSSPGQVRPTF